LQYIGERPAIDTIAIANSMLVQYILQHIATDVAAINKIIATLLLPILPRHSPVRPTSEGFC